MKKRNLLDREQQKLAKQKAKSHYSSYEFWYRQHYKLTENDPRFLEATLEQIMTDYWAFQYFSNPKLADEVEDEDFDQDDILQLMEAHPDDWQDMI